MSVKADWRIFTDIDEARASILKRHSLRDYSVPDHVAERLLELFGERVMPEEAVRRIIGSVRERGDDAILEWNRRIDGVETQSLPVAPVEMEAALQGLAPELRSALELAAERIRAFHQKQPLSSWIDAAEGESLGRLIRPHASLGVYVPGGTAPLPSSLLMGVIPAAVAGVPEIIVCTPPGSGGADIHPTILAAAEIAGVKAVYRVGGAQAIAGMAYGSESIPRVAAIVGAGNLFVTLAKQQVYGDVGIDGLLGPTETIVIADESADPSLAAADLLAQAEHAVLASAILLTPSREQAAAVGSEISRQLGNLKRRDIIQGALAKRSGAVVTADLEQAFELANEYAPEHLALVVDQADQRVGDVHNAGGLFVGEASPEALGDYVAGPSHVMPTGGTARFASPLNLLNFVKITSLVALSPEGAAALSGPAQLLAHAESLDAHAAAARRREQ